MYSHLDFVKGTFETQYAPYSWKSTHTQWDLEQQYQKCREEIARLEKPTVKDYQRILKNLFISVKDYHVGVTFFSTERSGLPFSVKSASGKYFISYVDEEKIRGRPLKVGDELLTFNGRPIHALIQEIRKRELGDHPNETDQALAEILLTGRASALGHRVERGEVSLAVRKKETNKIKTCTLPWAYVSEQISEIPLSPQRGAITAMAAKTPVSLPYQKEGLKSFFQREMVAFVWDKLPMQLNNPHLLGAYKSFVPPLGRKIWESPDDSAFYAYIFQMPNRERIGYVRIPHYQGDQEEFEQFRDIIARMEMQTEALVIDQLNNPGGGLFHLYALASTLTDQPLATPKHRLMLTQADVNLAVNIMSAIDAVADDESAQQSFGESVQGYPVDERFIELTRQFCDLIIEEWNAGNLYTKPTFLFGVDEVIPDKVVRYTKPILLLVNNLCFSCGDFFPAILQDNQRATVMGTRTAGAGGYVMGISTPNHLGVSGFSMTASIAERMDHQCLEDLGVTPDVIYEWTEVDLQENYAPYINAIHSQLQTLIKKG